jgi:hypothetical protein
MLRAMKATRIKRASALLHPVAANDNLSAAQTGPRARSSAQARSRLRQSLRRFVRPMVVAVISAFVVFWMSGAFLVGIAGILLLGGALAGWHLLSRRKMEDEGQRTEIRRG